MDRVHLDVWVELIQVIDKHAPPLKAQQTVVALVDETLVVGGRHLKGDKRYSRYSQWEVQQWGLSNISLGLYLDG